MEVIIDRFEGNYAVCEKKDGGTIDIRKDQLPADAVVGDVLKTSNNSIVIDKKATESRQERIDRITKDMWE